MFRVLAQVATLKDQLSQEVRKRQQYISKSSHQSGDLADIRSILDTSLTNVSRDPGLDASLLDAETRRLKEDLPPARLTPRHRSPARSPLLRAGGGGANRSGSFRMRSPAAMKKTAFKK